MIRALLVLAAAAAAWGGAVAATGGFDLQAGPVAVRSHNPVPAFLVAALCLAAACYRGLSGLREAVDWWTGTIERRAAVFAAAIAAWAVLAGAAWGTYVAGGPDSYCYVNQAELFARGDVREVLPLAAEAPWAGGEEAFVPIGHVRSPAVAGAVVPMCAAGYPLLMAAARLAAGRTAMFWIVPLMGGLTVWLAFALGRRVATPIAALLAALLIATSPAFLYQVVQPMTDVPAVALWTLALLAALRTRPSGMKTPFLAGVAAGAALMVRPNLLPLAAVTGGITCLMRAAGAELKVRPALASALSFAAGLLPFVVAVAAIQSAMYGGPLRSGYGDLEALFGVAHVAPNLQRYPVWLVRTETWFVLLALAAPWLLPRGGARRAAWWLLAFVAATFACYLPYEVFDAWWYLRFVLPAFPALFVLASAAFVGLMLRLRLGPHLRSLVGAAAAIVLVALRLTYATDGNAFRMHDIERRFREGGEYVASHLPADAAVVTVWQSGSVRFYSGRVTMVWNAVEPDALDHALEFLRAKDYRPYLLFERDEEQEFRRKFEGHSTIGAVDWPPVADINREVRIYDPADRERYFRGERIDTHRVRTAR